MRTNQLLTQTPLPEEKLDELRWYFEQLRTIPYRRVATWTDGSTKRGPRSLSLDSRHCTGPGNRMARLLWRAPVRRHLAMPSRWAPGVSRP